MAKVVLPIDGRAATIIKSPGCIPEVLLSSSKKPVVKPVIFPSNFESSSSLLITSAVTELIALGPESFYCCYVALLKRKYLFRLNLKFHLHLDLLCHKHFVKFQYLP